MTLIELKTTKQALKSRLSEYESIKPSCENCEYFPDRVKCEKFDAAPPPDWVIGKVECPQWEYDNVPFL